ncbi:MAG TPA: hypothetical protein VNB22_22985 [Pyrinomonadaceae bacterium]|nr:hypothetical protein [Pyrinomonadaceae bacterium]
MKKVQNPHDDYRTKLARDFATAFIGHKMNATFRTAQNYVSGKIGAFWFLPADPAIKSDHETMHEIFGNYQ